MRSQEWLALRRRSRTVVGIALLVFPHGGQFTSRRNVRESIVADQLRASARQDAADAIRDVEIAHRLTAAR